jgi:hypothetical protein
MATTIKKTKALNHNQPHKCPTGIKGFDQITIRPELPITWFPRPWDGRGLG